jgi:hypothetical protein
LKLHLPIVQGYIALRKQYTHIKLSGNNDTGTSTNDGSHCNHHYIEPGLQGLFKDVILCDKIFTPIPLQIQKGKFQQQDEEEEWQMFSSVVVHGPSGEDFDGYSVPPFYKSINMNSDHQS